MQRIMPHLPRLRIRSIVLMVNIIVILVPFSGMYFFKLYENELVRQTETELIAQGAYVAALFKHEVASMTPDGYGILLPNPPPKLDEKYNPILPRLNLAKAIILPPRPDAVEGDLPDTLALDAAQHLLPILQEARLTTLAGVSLMDYRGTVIMGQEKGLSLAPLAEVQPALQGRYHSVIRERIPEGPTPPLASLSRSTHIRVFVAMPIIEGDRLLGAVLLSRSPRNVLKALYEDQSSVLAVTATVLIAVLLISLLTSHAINQPIRALLRQVRRVAEGEGTTPIAHPITKELAQLSQQISLMAEKLHHRSHYIRNFAMHVSHEFKTPLTAIQGALELLEEHDAAMSKEERQKFLHNTVQDTNRLKALVTRLLELAKADAMQPTQESCDANKIIQSLIHPYRDRAFTVVLENTDATSTLAMPADIFTTVLVNLLDNSKQNGATEAIIRLEHEAEYLVITVKDNGNGMSEANASRLFTPFFTTHRDKGGTGLGLSIIQALLTAYQGSVALVEYTPHAVFRVRVPIYPPSVL